MRREAENQKPSRMTKEQYYELLKKPEGNMVTMTEAQVNAHSAKMMVDKEPSNKDGGIINVSRESELHQQILNECKRRGWIALHGSMADRTSRTLGEPDFCILMEKGIVLWVECKTKTGKLSNEQLGMKAWMEKLEHRMFVVRSFNDFLYSIAWVKAFSAI